jgi:hypothetical protein
MRSFDRREGNQDAPEWGGVVLTEAFLAEGKKIVEADPTYPSD